MIVNAPYSVLKELLEGLEGTGGACYRIREEHPALFRDYRVKYALVQALGASYAEFANDVAKWLCEDKDKFLLCIFFEISRCLRILYICECPKGGVLIFAALLLCHFQKQRHIIRTVWEGRFARL